MSVVIAFQQPGSKGTTEGTSRGPAKIIIFSGVRIERLNERSTKPAPARKRRVATRQMGTVAEQA
jgi:hypothetical protein